MAAILPPVPLTPPTLGGILSAASPLPPGIDPFPDGATLPIRPCGHGVVVSCACPVGATPQVVPVEGAGGQFFAAFPLAYSTVCKALNALAGPSMGTLAEFAADGLRADESWLLSQAMQFGVGGNPGLSTLPVGAGMCQVRVVTSSTEPVGVTAGIAALSSRWSAAGLPGTGVLHVPSIVASALAHEHQVVPGQTGSTFLAGGLLRVSFGPGYDPRIGPGGAIAPDGAAWIWTTGNFYAATTNSIPTVVDDGTVGTRPSVSTAISARENAGIATADALGFYAFNTCCVSAALVSVPC